MTGNDILNFLNTGVIHGINIGMSVASVKDTLGIPNENTGDENIGYLFYGILSLGYYKNTIDGIAINFFKDKTINVLIDENDFGESAVINGNTQIHEFIYLLNSRTLLWECSNTKELDYFTIRSKKGVGVIFDLYDGRLNRLSYAGHSL
ncbi:hypothetical protein [Paraflavitalea speifideaquila]|uniref:hypothetical protein n=1 Tax=Paraflavitalea speifideaquila TaxID=3076558 RepID=UPI0028EC097E|nr:hypothetical protein [Paraflavitalea speifideiaquila]